MTVIQHRRGTTAEWAASSYILEAGELGIEIDTSTTPDNVIGVKVGNGESFWSVLSYVGKGGLPVGGTAGQIVSKIDSTNYNAEWIDNYSTQTKYYVKLGEAINKGQAVYISAANGTNIIVSKASNNAEATSSKTIGLIETTGVLNDIVKVVSDGLLSGFDTSAATVGDPVWLGTSGNLLFGLANKPVAPAHMVYLGAVTRVHAINGEVFVHVQNGFEIDELHDVSISGKTPLDVLSYDATGVWKNKTITNAGIAALTGATFTGNIAINNSTSTALTTTGTTAALFNTAATTLNIGGDGTAINIGATTGTLTLKNPTIVGSQTTQNLFNTVATTLNVGGAATTIAIGAGTGTTTVNNNLSVAGSLTVTGTITTQGTSNLTVQDPMIYLGEGNTANILDLGFVASFNNGTYQHAGLVRDASDGIWKLFSGVVPEPTGTVDFTSATYDALKIGALTASSGSFSSTLGVTGATTLSSTLNVSGAAQFNGGFSVDSSAFSVQDATGNTSVGGTMTIGGATTLYQDLIINNARSINLYDATSPTNVRTGRLLGSGGILYLQGGIDATDTTGRIILGRTASTANVSQINLRGDSVTAEGTLTVSSTLAANGGITNSDATKPMSVAAGYTTAGGFSGTKVVMTATATGQTPPGTRPGGGALQAGDIWIGW